jgi:hypothetical protein
VTYNWNLDTQYAFTPNLIMELGYVGQRSYRTEAPLLQNIPMLASPAAPVNCGGPSGCITTNTAANAPQRVPVIGMVAGGFSSTANIGQSSYHALQVTVRKTLSRGLQFQAAYTWGKCLSNYVGTSTAASGQGGNVSYNRADPRTSKGECGYDRPQRLVINYLYNLPNLHNGQGIFGNALSRWALAAVITAQSGNPIALSDSRGGQVYGGVGTSAANLCPGKTINDVFTKGTSGSRLSNYFDKSAFCATPIVGAINGVGGATGYGNIALDPVLGPGQFNWDMSVQKKMLMGQREGSALEFRADVFNAFNHPQFSNPASNVGAGTFGVITTTSVGPRIIQLALKYSF